MARESDKGIEREPTVEVNGGGAAAIADRKPRGAKGGRARWGAPGMVDRPSARGGSTGAVAKRSFFEVYKRNQGTYTRTGTAVGAGVILLAGGDFLYKQLALESDAPWTLWVQIGIPLVVLVVLGLLLWWLVGANRKTCDFMIATEGEMKKVSWSSKKELVGSTKVVILFTVALAVILFVVDIIFMTFFNWIGVLRGASVSEVLFGA